MVRQPATWTLYVLYTWSGVFASLVVVRFWTLLGDLFSIGQAKRVFAFIGAGASGGAILGSLLARALTDSFEPRHLLLASTLVLIATSIATRFLLPATHAPATSDPRVDDTDWRWPLQAIWMRQVKTTPGDFLRAKFAYQAATRDQADPSQKSKNAEEETE